MSFGVSVDTIVFVIALDFVELFAGFELDSAFDSVTTFEVLFDVWFSKTEVFTGCASVSFLQSILLSLCSSPSLFILICVRSTSFSSWISCSGSN